MIRDFKNKATGPLITLVTILVSEILNHTQWNIPNAPAIIVTTVIFSGFVGGMASSLVSGIFTWAYIVYFFSIPNEIFHYDEENIKRVISWTFIIPAMALMIGKLKHKLIKHERSERDRLILLAEERAILEESERQKNQLLKTLNMRDEFISLACHELNTPLTGLKLKTQMVKRKMSQDKNVFSTLDQTMDLIITYERQIDRLTRLVESMLDISKINTVGKFVLDYSELEITDFVKMIIGDYYHQFETNHSQIALHANNKIHGEWDSLRIEQVVLNLLSNAVKYGDNKPVNIYIDQIDDFVRIKFIDQGIGISVENHDRIFERFERAVKPTHFAGLGIGLYLVKQIVEAHKGKIYIESELDKGSTFIVELPLHANNLNE